MKKLSIFFLILVFATSLNAQVNSSKTFWSETFDEGDIPEGWENVALNDSSVVWFVTNQPFPGSFGRDYQAPPIASKSRGYHLQFAPGIKVGKNKNIWKKNKISPDAYIQTPAIDCSKHKSVVLTFQQNFFWGEWEQQRKRSGLIVAVSNDGKSWTKYDVHKNIGPTQDSPNPMDVELNITRIAAGQKTVYIRFWWQKMYTWYWMIDDIALSEALTSDIQAQKIVSPLSGNNFTNNDKLTFDIVNLGAKPIEKDFNCYLTIDNRAPITQVVKASKKHSIGIIDTLNITFPNLDLSDMGVHKVKFVADLQGDERRLNDTIVAELYSQACSLGRISDVQKQDKEIVFTSGVPRIKVQFLSNDVFRIQMNYNGVFTNPAGNDLIINQLDGNVNLTFADNGDYYLMQTPKLALRAYKTDTRFELYKADNKTVIWKENKGMTYGKQTIQYLKRGETEQFFGGGQQNGRFSHRDKTIKMTIDYNWEDGGNPNPATFYMSTAGYGAVRNTYSRGAYTFGDTVKTVQNESCFDCYYMVNDSLKGILNLYTDLTGKPFMVPRWGLGMGDSNCYNRGARSNKTNGSTTTGHSGLTPSVISLIADKYIEYDMPRGWILPNDGYGCGYTDLKYTIDELKKRGFHTGLWTENGVEKIAREVGEYGSRLCKLDVAWIGPGFKFAIDGAHDAFNGIENNSNGRGFVWMVCGWTGSQRNAVLWTGDQSGSWNYIKWHIPTIVGSGLSAQNYATGDVDGIFGGSDSTYVRDLQFKSFTPVFMTMSGWARNNKQGIVDKQPWLFGEPYTSINRKYLKLKERLTPYMYTLIDEAHRTGVPAVRGLVLEYPNDPVTATEVVKYEFLLGKDFLVAPVYTSSDVRDSIYLPEGNWIDYWDGKVYTGKQLLKNYNAPLEKLPLFVRSGAIIPMYQQMMYDKQYPIDTLTLDIYPNGNSSYKMYEDDGDTQDYKKGRFAYTTYFVTDSNGIINISSTAAEGDYEGREKARTYILQIHTKDVPQKVVMENKTLKKLKNAAKYNNAATGWYVDTKEDKQVLTIKTPQVSTDKPWSLTIK